MSENKASGKTTIVLVHGAFADSSGWNEIISTLLTLGYPVVAASNPLRSLTYARGVAIPASSLGKVKMIAQVVAILALILSSAGPAAEAMWWIGQAALWVVVVAALISAADYFRRFNLFPRNDVIARDDRVA